jgi:sugar phosphate isomerase/epimerase
MRLVALAVLVLAAAQPAPAGDSLNCRDGKDAPPRLQLVQNLWGLSAYPSAKDEWPLEKKLAEIKAAGFDAFDVWVGDAKEEDVARWEAAARASGLAVGVEFAPTRPEDADAAIATARRLGSVYLDAHAASYFTPEAEAEALLRGLVERCRAAAMPLVVQTHRGRVTQDLLRTVGYAQRIPDLRFDLDFSHYIVAGELGGEFSKEAAAALFVLADKAIMLDGRVSNGEQVQVDADNPAYARHVERTSAMWKHVMVRWLKYAERGDVFPFRVELGPPDYAILGADGREISDRWARQKAMKSLVERLWNEAVAETGRGQRHGAP